MERYERTRLLVLCKNYPSPSAGYVETSCVAAMTEGGQLIRLYPVPFRLLEADAQFKKWQWIDVDIARTGVDHRPESRRIRADTITCIGKPLSTRQDWAARRPFIDSLRKFPSFEALEQARQIEGVTLGLLVRQEIVSLELTRARQQEWSSKELAKLSPAQGNLFSEPDRQAFRRLEKLAYDFHYRYRPQGEPGATVQRHKIVDWEAGALYRNVVSRSSGGWEAAFKAEYERELPRKDLMLLMGTIHRFPDQWLIVSVITPPHERNLRLL